jgi:hypothetical protein
MLSGKRPRTSRVSGPLGGSCHSGVESCSCGTRTRHESSQSVRMRTFEHPLWRKESASRWRYPVLPLSGSSVLRLWISSSPERPACAGRRRPFSGGSMRAYRHRFFVIGGGLHLEATPAQRARQTFAQRGIAIGDQDRRRVGIGSQARRLGELKPSSTCARSRLRARAGIVDVRSESRLESPAELSRCAAACSPDAAPARTKERR